MDPAVTVPSSPESEAFAKLKALCRQPGYAHALAAICARNDWITSPQPLTEESLDAQYDASHLVRAETSTLIHLLARPTIDYTHPGEPAIRNFIERTYSLLEDLHSAIGEQSFSPLFEPRESMETLPPNLRAPREALLYTGDTAYHFQYLDFARTRYARDDAWFRARLSASIDEICSVLAAIVRVQQSKFRRALRTHAPSSTLPWLDTFTFTSTEVSVEAQVNVDCVERILRLFTLSPSVGSHVFDRIDHFNPSTEKPIVGRAPDAFVLFQFYTLMESFYSSPVY